MLVGRLKLVGRRMLCWSFLPLVVDRCCWPLEKSVLFSFNGATSHARWKARIHKNDERTFKAEQNATAAKEEKEGKCAKQEAARDTQAGNTIGKTGKRKHTLSPWTRQIRRWLGNILGPRAVTLRHEASSWQLPAGKRRSQGDKKAEQRRINGGCGSFSTLKDAGGSD